MVQLSDNNTEYKFSEWGFVSFQQFLAGVLWAEVIEKQKHFFVCSLVPQDSQTIQLGVLIHREERARQPAL